MIIEHPSGIIEVGVDIDMADGGPQVTASIVRTARRLFAGYIYVPDSVWANEQSK
jgi:4-oxalomesaconate tautomerase